MDAPNSLSPSRALGELPLAVGLLDHYTLIVPDAAAASRFHTDVLGFTLTRIQSVNAGSVPEGQYDMLNYVLEFPAAPGRVLVITEGLTPESIFQKYLVKYGPGVHHIAYEVPDIDQAFATLRREGYRLTSEQVLRDPLTGLRQVFISHEHGGYFIELIERTELAVGGAFTEQNMAALAQTMSGYVGERADVPGDPVLTVAVGRDVVAAFVADPTNLGRWTGHRGVRRVDGALVEVRMCGDVPLDVSTEGDRVAFTWRKDGRALTVGFIVTGNAHRAQVAAVLPPFEPTRLARARSILTAELNILGALLENRPADQADLDQVDAFHLDVHQRRGL